MMPGMIMLWYGSVATIPSGWALCDGNNGTPDLRTIFVAGAGSALTPGDTGGFNTHSHPFTGDGHSHDLTAGNKIIDSDPAGDYDHHSSTNPASGTTDAQTHWPPFHALCYIMKLSIP